MRIWSIDPPIKLYLFGQEIHQEFCSLPSMLKTAKPGKRDRFSKSQFGIGFDLRIIKLQCCPPSGPESIWLGIHKVGLAKIDTDLQINSKSHVCSQVNDRLGCGNLYFKRIEHLRTDNRAMYEFRDLLDDPLLQLQAPFGIDPNTPFR